MFRGCAGNHLGDRGVKYMANVLKTNDSLTSLDLRGSLRARGYALLFS